MSEVLNKVLHQIEEAKKSGRVPQKSKDREFSPFANKNNMLVYRAIKQGMRAGNHGHILGCTDEELRKLLNLNKNTVRWSRYSMVQGGYIKYAGFTRGKVKSKVWIVNPEMPVQIPDTTPLTPVCQISECKTLSIVSDRKGNRFLVIDDNNQVFDGESGELLISVVRLNEPDKAQVTYLKSSTKVVIESNINDGC